jgi:hypothetical protein
MADIFEMNSDDQLPKKNNPIKYEFRMKDTSKLTATGTLLQTPFAYVVINEDQEIILSAISENVAAVIAPEFVQE